MKTIALIEYHYGSHHTAYLRIFSQALLELGYRVMVFSPEPEEVREWILYNSPPHIQHFHAFSMSKDGKSILPIIGRKLPTFITILERWVYAAGVIREASDEIKTSPDLVFFNSLDSYFSRYIPHHAVDFVFPYNWSGISMQAGTEILKSRQHSSFVLSKYLNHWVTAQSSRCCAVGVLDEESVQELRNRTKKNIVIFPDITENVTPDSNYVLAQQIQEQAVGRKVVGLIGSLQKRKGLLTLLEVAHQCKNENLFFVFAGQLDRTSFSPEELSRLLNVSQFPPNNCFIYFNRIPDEPQFNAIINISDILFAAYEGFPNSSNILTKAAVFKKPVIVSKGFCMGERVRKFNLGLTISEGSVSECIQAIDCLSKKIDNDREQVEFGFERYRLAHSPEKLKKVLSQLIEKI